MFMALMNPITLTWKNEILTLKSSGAVLEMHYLEAFCRAGSTHRDWSETVIPHRTELLSAAPDGTALALRSTLADGVIVDHHLTAARDEVTFDLTLHNPTDVPSQAYWGQPCLQIGPFAGFPEPLPNTGSNPGPEVEDYLSKCFVFVDGRLERLPLKDWGREAIYTPGQVWPGVGVSAEDVNPRPLSPVALSNGLIGAFSVDETRLAATAWEPCQELFQGIYRCIHADFRIGGLEPGQTRSVRGKLYWMENDIPALLRRYEADFGK